MSTKRSLRIVAAMCVVQIGAAGSAAQDELRNIKHGEPIPAYELTTASGTVADSELSRGKVVVLIYLSAEQRSSEQAAAEASQVVKELAHTEVELLFVTADWIHKAYFEKKWEELEIKAPLAFDTGRELYAQLGLIVFPTTVVIDREGRLSHVISTRPMDYSHRLGAYVRHTAGLLDDAQLGQRLRARNIDRGSPKSLASRHRAAARLLRQRGLFVSAEEELIEAQRLSPESTDIRLDRANLHLLMDKTAEAGEIIDSVLEVEPSHRRAMLLRGIVLYRTDRLDEAEYVLKETLILNPDPARTHFYLGLVYEEQGETEKALEHYREALARVFDEETL